MGQMNIKMETKDGEVSIPLADVLAFESVSSLVEVVMRDLSRVECFDWSLTLNKISGILGPLVCRVSRGVLVVVANVDSIVEDRQKGQGHGNELLVSFGAGIDYLPRVSRGRRKTVKEVLS